VPDESQLTPSAVSSASPTALRACGLSERKASYLQDLAAHFEDGRLSDQLLTSEVAGRQQPLAQRGVNATAFIQLSALGLHIMHVLVQCTSGLSSRRSCLEFGCHPPAHAGRLLPGVGSKAVWLLSTRHVGGRAASVVPLCDYFVGCAGVSDAELLERLTAVKGIGPWTVDMVSNQQQAEPAAELYGCLQISVSKHVLSTSKAWAPMKALTCYASWACVHGLLHSS